MADAATSTNSYSGWIKYGIAGLAALFFIGSYLSAISSANRMEQDIKYQYEQNQNSLSKLSNSVAEAAQVPGMARDDLVKVTQAAMASRYGDGGSKAVFQSIKENYPGKIDPALYTKIQSIIESGRTDFENDQKRLLDKKRVYETALNSPVSGFWMKALGGYPKINLDDYKTINSGYTNKAFSDGVDAGIKVNPN